MKKMTIASILAGGVVSAAVFSGCIKTSGWSVNGKIDGASNGEKMALQGFNAGVGSWYLIDSIEIGRDGSFAYTSAQPSPYSDVYRLEYGGRAIYFPVDSIESLTVTTEASAFDTKCKVSGSDLAVAMQDVDQAIAEAVALNGEEATLNDALLKRRLTEMALEDANGVVAYYIINKHVGRKPLFDVNDRNDLRTIGAVANSFLTNRPDDPRTAYLEKLYIANRPSIQGGVTIEAEEVVLFDMELPDTKGVSRRLGEMASKGNVVLLSFVAYGVEPTAAYNVKLNEIYNANRDSGLDIYQVSVDPDEMAWKNSAPNLPWTSVYASPVSDREIIAKYNVAAVPMTYIIDRNGELAERVADVGKLSAAVKKYL